MERTRQPASPTTALSRAVIETERGNSHAPEQRMRVGVVSLCQSDREQGRVELSLALAPERCTEKHSGSSISVEEPKHFRAALTLTPEAVRRVRYLLDNQKEAKALKVSHFCKN